ncbi:hypothetical protein JYU34_015081 [Plutella xylostella]|uniref:Regulatory protein zeste n=1 Tax=Plutella xylostella TaxID=51655 RepID=A0ABQ7Q698_PLUXY|nr:hypothetical protein JYU34_015081 [Plutella xylostella]
MVEYIEQHGDLSKPLGGPHGRQNQAKRWKELTDLLNSDAVGVEKSEEKWRKVWSDLKNNVKKKWPKLTAPFMALVVAQL